MKKTIIKSTFYLILISVFAKALSFMVRIILARRLSMQAMSYYTLTSPTMVFVITLAQMGIPAALSKVIAQRDNASKPLKSAIILSIVNNLIITAAFLFLIPWLAHTVLKQDSVQSVLYAILPLIPMVTLSGLLKGYLLGIQRHLAATSSQIFEELSRIVFLFVIFSIRTDYDAISMARIAMLSVTVGEICSSIFMLANIRIKKRTLKRVPHLFTNLHKDQFDDLLMVSIPMTGSRLIGSLTYFMEPILMVIGLSVIQNQWMVQAYGQLNGYVLPIITMPSFITITLSNVLLPSFTYQYARGNTAQAKKLFNFIIGCCFLIGITCSFICYNYSEALLQLFYHNTKGAAMLKQLAWPFALYSLQPPLSNMLHALSRSHRAMMDTFFGSLVRILCVALLTRYILIDSLPLALCAGMLITTLLHCINLAISFRKSSI